MKPRRVTVNDKMQQGYEYELTAPMGREFAPDFTPDLTPAEMLRLGVFDLESPEPDASLLEATTYDGPFAA